jgi:predicted nucleotidyltransferase
VLVEFEPGATPGLEFFSMDEELAAILGKRVDLNTVSMLSQYYQKRVLRESVVIYDAA